MKAPTRETASRRYWRRARRRPLAIPATLQASLIARLDRLGTAAKEVAQVSAVLGRTFGYELIDRDRATWMTATSPP